MNRRHQAAVEALEVQATDLVVRVLADVLDGVASGFGALAAASAPEPGPPAEPLLSADDLGHIQTGWAIAVDGDILPWYGQVFEAGATAAVEQVAALRDVATVIISDLTDPLLLNEAATRHLATARNRFLAVGTDTWEKARLAMLEGTAAGEGIEPIRRRLQDVVQLSRAQAVAVARTEVISASNAGAVASVRQMGTDAPRYKQWLATLDGRTRPTHAAAMGQVVPLAQKFTVGGASLDYPGDPTGLDEEVINCRCTTLFVDDPAGDPALAELTDVTEGVAAMVAAANVDSTTGQEHTGSMVALVPAEPDTLTVHDGEAADQLHLTLWFLGAAADQPPEMQRNLLARAMETAAELPPVEADVFGAAVWNPLGADPCCVLNVGGGALTDVRDAMGKAVLRAAMEAGFERDEAEWEMPPNHTPWVPHVCVGYHADPGSLLPEALGLVGPVVFDQLRVTFGADVHDFPLAGAGTEPDKPAPESASTQVDDLPAVDIGISTDAYNSMHDKQGRFARKKGSGPTPGSADQPRQYGSGANYDKAAAEASLEEGWREWRGGLSADQKKAVRAYTDSDYCLAMNNHKRGVAPEPEHRRKQATTEKYARNMESAFDAPGARLPEDTLLHRNMQGPVAEALIKAHRRGGLLPPQEGDIGARFTDKGFVSTSLNPRMADRGSVPKNQRVRLEIDAAAGQRAIAPGSLSRFSIEDEVILPPGTKFEVRGAGVRQGVLTLQVRVFDG